MAAINWRALARQDGFRGWLVAAPPFAYALALLVLPIGGILYVSFTLKGAPGLSLGNYATALSDPLYVNLLLRSVLLSVLVSAFTVLLAYPVAYFIAFHAERHRALWLMLITLPFWTSYLLRVLSWRIALGQAGAINSALLSLGLIDAPLPGLLYNLGAVFVVLAHSYAVIAILPIYVSLMRIDRSLLEAATDLGDGPLRRFLRITLPLSGRGIIGALMVVMIPTAGDYVTPVLIGGTSGVMIANQIQAQFGRANNWPLGAALAVVTMLAIGLAAAASAGVLRRAGRWAR
jgi:spermidine/putrescine transport system permease protein